MKNGLHQNLIDCKHCDHVGMSYTYKWICETALRAYGLELVSNISNHYLLNLVNAYSDPQLLEIFYLN